MRFKTCQYVQDRGTWYNESLAQFPRRGKFNVSRHAVDLLATPRHFILLSPHILELSMHFTLLEYMPQNPFSLEPRRLQRHGHFTPYPNVLRVTSELTGSVGRYAIIFSSKIFNGR